MKSTREKILHTLLTKQQATINELAQIVGINGISVRHHLINLQAEGLINAEEQRHGVGRPRFVYRLTQRGLEKFPTNYLRFTELLIAKLQEVLSPQQLNKVFEGIGIQQAADIKEEVEGDTLDKRLDSMSIQLSNLGYRLDSRGGGQDLLIMNHNCPYHHIGVAHPEICKVDETMFEDLLGVPVKHERCIVTGDPHCVYRVKGKNVY